MIMCRAETKMNTHPLPSSPHVAAVTAARRVSGATPPVFVGDASVPNGYVRGWMTGRPCSVFMHPGTILSSYVHHRVSSTRAACESIWSAFIGTDVLQDSLHGFALFVRATPVSGAMDVTSISFSLFIGGLAFSCSFWGSQMQRIPQDALVMVQGCRGHENQR